MITIQYLEPGPHLAEISTQQVRDKLQAALQLLPIDCLLLGWDIPFILEDVCRKVVSGTKTKLYRWHPLLTGDGIIYPQETWRTRNLDGDAFPGFRDLPEFTFICPNNPVARENICNHLANIAQSARYGGIFLDRMRFPSPAANPINSMACFCEHCQNAAADIGLNLADVRQLLMNIDKLSLFHWLFGEKDPEPQTLTAFLDFRRTTITHFIKEITSIIRLSGLEIGLDCFSPSLTRMVGQDLASLTPLADWTKIMVYGHAFGPATLPFEFADLVNWLIRSREITEDLALMEVAKISSFPLPRSVSALKDSGFPPETLAAEVALGRQMGRVNQLLAGIELVEMSGISELNSAQIEADLHAIKNAGADGLSLSWDLWQIPLERLNLVNSAWFS